MRIQNQQAFTRLKPSAEAVAANRLEALTKAYDNGVDKEHKGQWTWLQWLHPCKAGRKRMAATPVIPCPKDGMPPIPYGGQFRGICMLIEIQLPDDVHP